MWKPAGGSHILRFSLFSCCADKTGKWTIYVWKDAQSLGTPLAWSYKYPRSLEEAQSSLEEAQFQVEDKLKEILLEATAALEA